MLEVISRGEASQRHPHPVLLVHGAWHGAWCWDGNLLDHLAARGFHVVALSLRGHGKSTTPKSVRTASISDYVDDVATVAERLPMPPVLVGHSMGGFVVQKYLETREAPAAVLLASTPPRGHVRLLLRLTRRHPLRSTKFAVTGQARHLSGTTAGARELFFSADTPESTVNATAARLGAESTRVILFDMAGGDLVDTDRVSAPVLIVGGERDPICGPGELERTGRAYGTRPVVIPDTGHELMFESSWRTTADLVERWLADRGL